MKAILLSYLLRFGSIALGLLALALAGFGTPDLAIAALAGGALMLLSMAGLVFFVADLLDSQSGGNKKLSAGLGLVLKLILVGGLLFALLQSGLSPLGLLLGLGVTLFSATMGLHRASQSKAGLAAMEAMSQAIDAQNPNDEPVKK